MKQLQCLTLCAGGGDLEPFERDGDLLVRRSQRTRRARQGSVPAGFSPMLCMMKA